MDLKLSFDDIKDVVIKKSYKWEEGRYVPFLYGIRSRSLIADLWNDVLGMCYVDDLGNKINLMHRGSTKPGLNWLKDKTMNIHGTAILIPAQHKDCWVIGTHKGYLALQQTRQGVFKVWRDGNRDGRFDFQGPVFEDVTGLNMHTESLTHDSEKVGAYSAGCQVRAFDKEHFAVMNLLQKSAVVTGKDVFSYTLLEERDFLPQ